MLEKISNKIYNYIKTLKSYFLNIKLNNMYFIKQKYALINYISKMQIQLFKHLFMKHIFI